MNKRKSVLSEQIDMSSLRILDTMWKRNVGEITFLLPKSGNDPIYYGIRVNGKGTWYTSADEMLDDAVRKGYIGTVKRTLLYGRYKRLSRRYGILKQN